MKKIKCCEYGPRFVDISKNLKERRDKSGNSNGRESLNTVDLQPKAAYFCQKRKQILFCIESS
jgi:hypothetical protein